MVAALAMHERLGTGDVPFAPPGEARDPGVAGESEVIRHAAAVVLLSEQAATLLAMLPWTIEEMAVLIGLAYACWEGVGARDPMPDEAKRWLEACWQEAVTLSVDSWAVVEATAAALLAGDEARLPQRALAAGWRSVPPPSTVRTGRTMLPLWSYGEVDDSGWHLRQIARPGGAPWPVALDTPAD